MGGLLFSKLPDVRPLVSGEDANDETNHSDR